MVERVVAKPILCDFTDGVGNGSVIASAELRADFWEAALRELLGEINGYLTCKRNTPAFFVEIRSSFEILK